MFWLRLMCVAAVYAIVLAQPMGCSEDSHCSSGFYCDTVRLYCQECLRCEDFRRAAPPARKCATSVTECGTCFTGPDDQAITSVMGCGSREARVEGRLLPPYGWAVLAALLLTALLLCVAAAYALRNFTAYKLLSASGTVQQFYGVGSERPAASAPPEQPPPSYHAAVATQAPNLPIDESSAPFIRTVGHSPQPMEERETLATQEAQVFSPPTYDSVGTMPAPTASVATMVPEDVEVIPARAMCRVRQDSNNSSEGSGDTEDDYPSRHASFLAQDSSPVIINVIKNVTTVQQHNEVTV